MWIYDNNGAYIGFTYNGVEYYYVYNLQGDVEAITDSTGAIVAKYGYDTWGEVETTWSAAGTGNIAQINPIRYRGYYYDSERGLYYLNSRYYDPFMCRFINADTTDILTATPTETTDKNLFAYCDNNPVLRADDGGEFWHIVVGAVVGAVVSGVAKVVSNAIEGKSLTDGLGTSMLAGAASGALASTGVGVFGQMVGNAAISMANNAADQVIENKGFNNFDVDDMLIDGVAGAVSGKLGGAGAGNASLHDAAKLMNKNIVRSVKNGTKNGVKGAVKRYAKSRAVKAFYTDLIEDIPLGILQDKAISYSAEGVKYCRRLYLMERC